MTAPTAHTRLLSELSARLGRTDGTRPVADLVLPAVVEAFGAAVGSLVGFRAPSTLHLVGTVGLEHLPEVAQDWAEFDVSAGVPIAEAARTGEPVWVGDVHQVPDRYPGWPPGGRNRAACALPMCAGGRLVGVLGLAWPEPREFSEADRETLGVVADIAAAACSLDRHTARRRLGVVDSETHRDDVRLAHLVRDRFTAVPRTVGTAVASGAPTLSWLLEAPHDVALGVACEGVLALARQQALPPGLAARNVADLVDALGGDVSGVTLQVGPDAAWLAVAGISDGVVLTAPVVAPSGVTVVAGSGSPADEHVVVPDGEGASVLALLLAPGLSGQAAGGLVDVARSELVRRRDAPPDELLARLGERLGEHGLDGALLGALAVSVAPRPGLPVLRRRLPARPLAVPLARRFALAALGDDPDGELSFRLAVVVDELVSNAVRHAEDTVDITVQVVDGGFRVEVTDDDDRPPLQGRPAEQTSLGEIAESGRGLLLVEAVADVWGVEVLDAGGKRVWAYVRQ